MTFATKYPFYMTAETSAALIKQSQARRQQAMVERFRAASAVRYAGILAQSPQAVRDSINAVILDLASERAARRRFTGAPLTGFGDL